MARTRLSGLLGLLAAGTLVLAGCNGEAEGGSDGGATTTAAADESAAPEGDAFYVPPDPLPEGEPGDVIWSAGVSAPDGFVGWRVLYLSESVAGDAIAVSGLVYAPEEPVAEDPLVIGYAHGTTGLGDSCAPSRRTDMAQMFGASGYLRPDTVLALTDYEGLGTPGVHPYIVGLSEGRSVLDSVRAAQNLIDSGNDTPVLIAGHSQGGGAALVAGEIAPTYAPELDVIGVVAGAPAAELRLIAAALANSPGFGFLPMAAAGFHAAYPELSLEEVLTPQAIAELDEIAELCVGDIIERYRGRDPATVLLADPSTIEPWSSILEENSPGVRQPGAPVLMIHGTADTTVPAAASQLVLDRYCRLGGPPVERRTYEGADHVSVIAAAQSDVEAFIDARLAGEEAFSSCPAG
jgi:pimeloyl-ACP methyl ester carboxylesterase